MENLSNSSFLSESYHSLIEFREVLDLLNELSNEVKADYPRQERLEKWVFSSRDVQKQCDHFLSLDLVELVFGRPGDFMLTFYFPKLVVSEYSSLFEQIIRYISSALGESIDLNSDTQTFDYMDWEVTGEQATYLKKLFGDKDHFST